MNALFFTIIGAVLLHFNCRLAVHSNSDTDKEEISRNTGYIMLSLFVTIYIIQKIFFT